MTKMTWNTRFCTAIKYIIARDYESRGYSNDQSRSKVFNEKDCKNDFEIKKVVGDF